MPDRKLKTWAEAKARRPLSVEAQAANATWAEQQIVAMNLQALRQQPPWPVACASASGTLASSAQVAVPAGAVDLEPASNSAPDVDTVQ